MTVSCQQKVSRLPEKGIEGGDIIIGIMNEPENLSPLYPSFSAHNEITDMLYLPLHKLNHCGEIVPMLANSWEYSEDLTRISYNLNRNIVWQDGKPVTAKDVEFTFNKMKDPKNQYPYLSKLQYIDSVKVTNEYTVVFFFSKVYPRALYDSNIKTIPMHILKDEADIRYADFHMTPVCNGPYKLDKWDAGKYISLIKNEKYSLKDKPFMSKIIYSIYSNQQDMIDDLKKGNLDIAYDISPEKQKEIEKLGNVNPVIRKGNTFTYMGFNLSKKPFDNKEVRIGISKLINRDGMIKNYVGGNAIKSNGPLTPAFWSYSENVKPTMFNKKDAETLLNKHMKKVSNNYYFKNKKFSFTILTDKNDLQMVKIANAISSDLKKSGINAKVKTLESDELIIRLIKKDFDAYVLSWTVDENYNPYPFWSSNKNVSKFNFVGYYNDKIDEILNYAVTSMEKDVAFDYWEQFQKTIAEDEPYAFLYIPNRVIAVNKVIHSFDGIYESETDILSNLDIFYVEKNNQKSIDIASLFKTEKKKTTTTTTTKKKEETVTEKKPTAAQLLSEAAAKTPVKTEKEKVEDEVVEEEPVEEEKPKIILQPQLKKLIQPIYPDAAAKVGAEGMIFVQVTVGTNGKVIKTTVLKGGNTALENAALNAAKKCEFKPGTIDGVPSEMNATIPYRFVAP